MPEYVAYKAAEGFFVAPLVGPGHDLPLDRRVGPFLADHDAAHDLAEMASAGSVPCEPCKGMGDRGWPPRECPECEGTGSVSVP